VGKVFDGGSESGREEEGLPFARKGSDDFFDITEEAHVEHAINFVEDKIFDTGEIDVAFIHMIQKSSGTGHKNIDSILHGSDLRVFTYSAEDEGFAEAEMSTIGFEALRNLAGKFPGGSEDKDLRCPPVGAPGSVVERVKNGQGKGSSLTGSGLSDANEVSSLEQDRNRLGLNRGWSGVILLGESTLDGSSQGQLLK